VKTSAKNSARGTQRQPASRSRRDDAIGSDRRLAVGQVIAGVAYSRFNKEFKCAVIP
jgi:hypothetical protein